MLTALLIVIAVLLALIWDALGKATSHLAVLREQGRNLDVTLVTGLNEIDGTLRRIEENTERTHSP